MPAALHRALYDAGLFHFLLPKDVGGYDVPLPEALRIFQALAEIDASTAWCVAIGGGTAAFGSMMSPEAVSRSLWSQPLGVAAGTFMPSGKAVLEDGVYHVSGRWAFCSGCVGAGWYLAYCVVYDGNELRIDETGKPGVVALPVPMTDCRIDPTWDSAGLRGTGSHHVSIEAASVPAAYGFDLFGAGQPGTPLHGFPLWAMLDSSLTAIMTGVVRAAFSDLFKLFGARAQEKGGLESFPVSVALEVAELLAEAEAWRTRVFDAVDRSWEKALLSRANGGATIDDGLDLRLASKVAARRGPKLVSAVALLAGGRSLVESAD
ncbi:MAG TPA: hypothetical protein VFD39_05430, partial [Trueperaceae bacterium]|nr:hypothetical protein [Trueperaceae bacterium]